MEDKLDSSGMTSTSTTGHKSQQNCWRRRTRLEKLLIVVVVCLFLIVVVLVVIAAIYTGIATSSQPSVCLTNQCIKSAARILESTDHSVDPCSDFFEFACGQWNREHPIPDERTKYDVFTLLNDGLQDRLKSLLETPASSQDIPVIRNTKFLYQSCVNLTAMAEREDDSFRAIVTTLGGWPVISQRWDDSDFDLATLLGRLRAWYGYTPLVTMYVSVDEKNSVAHRIVLNQQAQLPMTHRDYYLKGRDDNLLQVYRRYAMKVVTSFGADESQAERDVEDIIDFEIDLANITIPMDERRKRRESQYNKYRISELSTNLTDTIDWLRFVTMVFSEVGIDIADAEEVIVLYPDYVYELGRLLQKTSPRTLQNYVVWWVLTTTNYELVSQKFQNLRKDFNKAIMGTDQDPVRWRSCVNFVNLNMGVAVGRMYVEEYFSKDARENALNMVAHVRQSFSEILQELTWLEDGTKKVAQEKVDAIREKIGYPDFILNNTALEEVYAGIHCWPDSFFTNIINISRASVQINLLMLRRPYDRDRWDSTPVTPNAFYHPSKNIIMFPAGILQPPFYHKNNPMYLNFGGIATIIGHEITHGFDDQGRLFDKDGNVKLWWSEVDVEKFIERAQCFIDQYSNYTVPEVNMNINGRQTLGENIADNGGLKQAYRAYKRWVEEHGEEALLPGINYTQTQLFFLNFAHSWCGSSRPELQLRWMRSFPHSPRHIRVIGTLSNLPEFAAAYHCPAGSPMNPVDKCRVW